MGDHVTNGHSVLQNTARSAPLLDGNKGIITGKDPLKVFLFPNQSLFSFSGVYFPKNSVFCPEAVSFK